MPILNRAAELQPEVAAWRRHLHENPELDFDVHQTGDFVAAKLAEFGADEIVRGIGRTGLVGVIRGRLGDGPTIGLRADMDALPILEESGAPWTSKTPGKMHACGHDGHIAMLLGAAKYLAETRNFAGSVALIFQPAEESNGGGNEMVKDGMMERFSIGRVFGLHNAPGIPAGEFSTRTGGIMAGCADFRILVTGKGGHAAYPHHAVDSVLVASQIVVALQAIRSRNIDPIDSFVLSTTMIHGGDATNIIPQRVELQGTVRALDPPVLRQVEERMRIVCDGVAASHGATAEVFYRYDYPVTVNHAAETELACDVASDVAGERRVSRDAPPELGTEDFSYMLEARPGAFMFIGNGDTPQCHHPAYDFNDEIIPAGISYWVRLAETVLKP